MNEQQYECVEKRLGEEEQPTRNEPDMGDIPREEFLRRQREEERRRRHEVNILSEEELRREAEEIDWDFPYEFPTPEQIAEWNRTHGKNDVT